MLHPKAIIERPPAKAFDTTNVIKADQFPSWHKKFADTIGVGAVFKAAMNMRSRDTIKEWGEKLIRQHRPGDLMALPDFMRPHEPANSAHPAGQLIQKADGGALPIQPAVNRQPLPIAADKPIEEHPVKKLICAQCGVKISYPDGKFCWNNEKRFGGLQYCREHQATTSR